MKTVSVLKTSYRNRRLPVSKGNRVAFQAGVQSVEVANRLRQLKTSLTGQLRAEFGHSIEPTLFHQAIQEADSLAATTAFPTLFLPALAEEKVRKVYRWSQRQRAILEQSIALAV